MRSTVGIESGTPAVKDSLWLAAGRPGDRAPDQIGLESARSPRRRTALDEDGVDELDAPARISSAALAGTCAACVDALSMFVDAYGAATDEHRVFRLHPGLVALSDLVISAGGTMKKNCPLT